MTEPPKRRARVRRLAKSTAATLGAALSVVIVVAIEAGSASGGRDVAYPEGGISWCAHLGQRPPMQAAFRANHTQGLHKYGWRLLIDGKDVVSGAVELDPLEWFIVPHQHYPVSIGSNYVLRLQDKDAAESRIWTFQSAHLYDCAVPPTTVEVARTIVLEVDPGR